MHEKLDCSRELIIAADLIEHTLGKGFNAVARRIHQLGAEVTEAVLDDFDEELIVGRTFDRLFQFTAAGLMNAPGELFCGGCRDEIRREPPCGSRRSPVFFIARKSIMISINV